METLVVFTVKDAVQRLTSIHGNKEMVPRGYGMVLQLAKVQEIQMSTLMRWRPNGCMS